jgi:hydroxypyruvate reductase
MDEFSPQSPRKPEQRRLIQRVLNAALDAVNPGAAVVTAIQRRDNQLLVGDRVYDMDAFRRILVCGVGKASISMTAGLGNVIPGRIQGGVIITKSMGGSPQALPAGIQVLKGGHPVPTQDSLESTQHLFHSLNGLDERDLVFCLISGGGSALMVDPVGTVTLEDLQELTRVLLACGASIAEINTLRKHLDRVKGGGLLKRMQPAVVVSLVMSDVVGNDLSTIASGPTVPDPSTYQDAFRILNKYGIEQKIPEPIRIVIRAGMDGLIPETMKPGEMVPDRMKTVIVGSNLQAAEAAAREAASSQYRSIIVTTHLQGEARQAGETLTSVARDAASSGHPIPRPACIIVGGETTVTLQGVGRGGRNQEAALGAVYGVAGLENMALVTLATDGEDGPTDAAGAVVTGDTLARARQLGLDPVEYLRRNDAYTFFDRLGDLVKTGPTGTNVNDLAFIFTFAED